MVDSFSTCLGGCAAVLFVALIAIVITSCVLIAANPTHNLCNATGKALCPKEQMICKPKTDEYEESWIADFDDDAKDSIKVYREVFSRLSTKTEVRTISNKSVTVDDGKNLENFTISVPVTATIDLNATCISGCDKLELRFCDETDFENAFKEDGEFGLISCKTYVGSYKDTKFVEGVKIPVFKNKIFDSNFYQLVFYMSGTFSSATVVFDLNISYEVLDLSGSKETEERDFSDLVPGEVIIIDYPSATGQVVNASIYFTSLGALKWFGIIVIVIICGVGCVITFSCSIIFIREAVMSCKSDSKKATTSTTTSVGDSSTVQMQPVDASTPYAPPVPENVPTVVVDTPAPASAASSSSPYESGVAPTYESGVAPGYESGVAPAYESAVAPSYESGVAPGYESAMAPGAM